MKTVQEYLRMLDKDKLIKMYISRLCENPKFFDSDDAQLFVKIWIKIGDYIERLKHEAMDAINRFNKYSKILERKKLLELF